MADISDPTTQATAATIALPERLDTGAAEALHGALMAHDGSAVALEGSAVTMLGGRCLDLLMTARHHWNNGGHGLSVANPSDAMLRDLATFGTDLDAITVGGRP